MSSFVRRGSSGSSSTDIGTRAGGYGQTLVSCGHVDVDRILGGGLPLGSLLVIFEDEWTSHHITLVKMFLAEGAVCGHSLMLATAKELLGGVETFIPRHVPPRSDFDSRTKADDDRGSQKAAANEDDETEPQLRIAWQYGRYLRKQQQQHGGSSGHVSSSFGSKGVSRRPLQRDWCHEFDLTKSAGAEGLARCRIETKVFSGERDESLAAETARFTESLKTAEGTHRVGRCVILSLGDVEWGTSGGAGSPDPGRCIVQSLIGVKLAIRESQCAAVVSIPRALVSGSDVARITHVADVAVTLTSQSQSSDLVRLAPDAASICALLQLVKSNSLGIIVSPGLSPQNSMFFLRHKRRRIAITPIEVDPDKEADGAPAGPGCAGSGGEAEGSKLLVDF